MARSTFLSLLAAEPVTAVIVVICVAIWLIMWNRRIEVDDYATSYAKVVLEGQYYRIVTATFCHLSLLHLLFNSYGLFQLGFVETFAGSYYYVVETIMLLALSEAIFLGTMYVMIVWGRQPAYATSSAAGYSGVLYGVMTLAQQAGGGAVAIPLVGGYSLPLSIAPFITLAINQLLVPKASFVGHLAGIIAGLLLSWGAGDWLMRQPYWFWTSAAYGAAALVFSLRRNPRIAPRWLGRVLVLSPAAEAAASVEGAPGTAAAASAPRRYMDAGGVLRVAAADIEFGRPLEIVDVGGGGGGDDVASRGRAGRRVTAAWIRGAVATSAAEALSAPPAPLPTAPPPPQQRQHQYGSSDNGDDFVRVVDSAADDESGLQTSGRRLSAGPASAPRPAAAAAAAAAAPVADGGGGNDVEHGHAVQRAADV